MCTNNPGVPIIQTLASFHYKVVTTTTWIHNGFKELEPQLWIVHVFSMTETKIPNVLLDVNLYHCDYLYLHAIEW